MCEANLALIRLLVDELFNNRQFDLIEKIYHPAVVFHDPSHEKTLSGLDKIREAIDMYTTGFPDFKFIIHDTIAEGDKVVIRWTMTGNHEGELMAVAPSNQKVAVDGVTICQIQDGKIIEIWQHWDKLGMMKQCGMFRPQPGG